MLIKSLWEELKIIIIVLDDFVSGIKTPSNNEQEGIIFAQNVLGQGVSGSFTHHPSRYKSIKAKFWLKIKNYYIEFLSL